MATIGIDLGSKKAVIGVVRGSGIDIILNDASNRNTEVKVAYTPEERLIGGNVTAQLKKNLPNSILFSSRFLGLNQACKEQIALEQRFITNKFEPQADGKLRWKVKSAGQSHELTIEQIVGFYLTKLRGYYETAGVNTKDVVLSIPSYCSNVERQALLDAAEIAGLKCLRVINESTAICMNYGFFRKGDLDDTKARTVAFVDFGHSKTTCTIASFVKSKCKILCHHSDRNLGARDMDWEIFQHIGEDFAKKNGCDPRKSDKAKVRMLEAIEKARTLLSGVPDANINLEYLYEDYDLNTTISRDTLHKLSDPIMRRLHKLLEETIALSGLKPDQINFVELISDATRTPIVQEIIQQVFQKQELSRTLNSLETVARGASLQAAMLSPFFNVSKFVIEEWNPMSVTIDYKFNTEDKGHTMEIIKKKTNFPVTQKVTFDNKLGDCSLLVRYSDSASILAGLPREIAKYEIKAAKLKHAGDRDHKFKFILMVSNNIHQVPCLENAQLIEEWTEEKKVPKNKPAPAKPAEPAKEGEDKKEEVPVPEPVPEEFEIKTASKSSTSSISWETSSYALTPDQRKVARDAELAMRQSDDNFLTHKATRNELETLSYSLKRNLADGGAWIAFADEATRQALLAESVKCIEWIDDDAESAPLLELQEKLAHFKKFAGPVSERANFVDQLPQIIAQFTKAKTALLTKASENEFLNEEKRKLCFEKATALETFFAGIEAELKANDLKKPLTSSVHASWDKIAIFKSELEPIVNSTVKEEPPKEDVPMKEDPPTEPKNEASEEGAGEAKPDVEMK